MRESQHAHHQHLCLQQTQLREDGGQQGRHGRGTGVMSQRTDQIVEQLGDPRVEEESEFDVVHDLGLLM